MHRRLEDSERGATTGMREIEGAIDMYVNPNYPSKKAFKQAVLDGVKHYPYNPSGMFPPPANGRTTIEGPHYPKPHKWYADVDVVNGVVTKVR